MTGHFKLGTAVITGAASGVGRATSLLFARDGCRKLVLGDISESELEKTRKLILDKYSEARVVTSKLDVTDETEVDAFYALAVEKFGRIDFAVNIASAEHPGAPSINVPQSDFQVSYNENLRAAFLCERAELRQMSKQELLEGYESRGSIVNVTSLCSTIAMPGLTAFSGTQGGILGLTKTDALDFGPQRIRVNCVAPGNVATSMLDSAMGEKDQKECASRTPLRRLGESEDIANAVVWLSSPMAAYITGISLPVDGGFCLSTGPP